MNYNLILFLLFSFILSDKNDLFPRINEIEIYYNNIWVKRDDISTNISLSVTFWYNCTNELNDYKFKYIDVFSNKKITEYNFIGNEKTLYSCQATLVEEKNLTVNVLYYGRAILLNDTILCYNYINIDTFEKYNSCKDNDNDDKHKPIKIKKYIVIAIIFACVVICIGFGIWLGYYFWKIRSLEMIKEKNLIQNQLSESDNNEITPDDV